MRLSALFLAIAASLLIARPATAERIEHFKKIGNWDGGAYTHSKTGKFSHCAASASYRNGNTLIFAIYKNRTWALGIANKDWKLKVGDTYAVRYRIDKGAEHSGKAGAVADNQIKLPLPGDNKLFDRMRNGSLLTVVLKSKTTSFETTKFETTKFKLTSTNAILTRLFKCVGEWRKNPKYQ